MDIGEPAEIIEVEEPAQMPDTVPQAIPEPIKEPVPA